MLPAPKEKLLVRPVTELLINLDVSDLAAAERFYRAAFGLRAARHLRLRTAERTWANLRTRPLNGSIRKQAAMMQISV
jgi:predicted enzyme related to lactoylglutathione lyase